MKKILVPIGNFIVTAAILTLLIYLYETNVKLRAEIDARNSTEASEQFIKELRS